MTKTYEMVEDRELTMVMQPDLEFRVADEYNTRVIIHLPTEQKLLILTTTDHRDNMYVYWRMM